MNLLKFLKSVPKFFFPCLFILVISGFVLNTKREFGPSNGLPVKLQKDFLINSYEWLICGPNSWEDLKIYLPEAKMSSISVWVNLLPPYQSTPVCLDGTYSEPFQQDYIRWAEEIAMLSLRYSNLIGYGIDDFQQNVNLGYLRQSYIDSMIAAGKSINPRLQFITTNTLPKIYYVDRDASGTGTGLSWTNAATSLYNLDFDVIQGGDTVYISGGSDSTTYSKDAIWDDCIIPGSVPVVVTKGWEAGHNGEVYFVSDDTLNSPTKHVLSVFFTSNVKVTNLNIYWTIPYYDVSDAYACVAVLGSDNVTIDNCNIISNGRVGGILCNYSYHTFTNNYIKIGDANDYPNFQDGIFCGVDSKGGYTITGNEIYLGNTTDDTWHSDFIQFSYDFGGTENNVTTVANNFCYSVNPGSDRMQFIYSSTLGSNIFKIYNNLVVISTKELNCMVLLADGADADHNSSLHLFNNTFVLNGSTMDWGIQLGNIDTAIIKNNIMMLDNPTATNALIFWDTPSNQAYAQCQYKDIDYNIWYKRPADTDAYYVDGAYKTWAQWQALGWDTNSDSAQVTFANKYGTNIADYLTTTGRDAGVDLAAFFTTDILGVTRPKNAVWDLGCLEYNP